MRMYTIECRGQRQWPRVPGCDSIGEAKRSNPTSKKWWLRGCRRAKRSYSTSKVRRGGQ